MKFQPMAISGGTGSLGRNDQNAYQGVIEFDFAVP